jgi:uncharacterized protein YukE
MSANISFQYMLNFCIACQFEMRDYLLAKILYWPLQARAPSGEPTYPMMTIGSVMLVMMQARALAMTTMQSMELDRVEIDLYTLRKRWRATWERKAHEEFHARLRRWSQFIVELRRQDEGFIPNYRYEVRWRVILELLTIDLDNISIVDQNILAECDQQLLAELIPGEFIWESGFADGFPQEVYWYLWGNFPA